MADEIEIGSKAIKQIQQLKDELLAADQALIKLSQNALQAGKNIGGISTPGGLSKAGNDNAKTSAELERQSIVIKNLSDQILKLTNARIQNNKVSAEESVNQRILNQNALNEAKSVSNLVGAYQKLNLQHQKALKTAQDLGVQYGLNSQQFIKASAAANVLDKELKDIDYTLGRSQRNVGNYGNSFNALGSALGQLGLVTGVGGVIALGMNAVSTSKELQSLNLALQAVTGTQEEYAKQQLFLTGIADKYGLQIEGLTEQFTSFYVSAKGKLAGKDIQEVFENISKSGSALGLSNDSLKRSFAALNQMLSKGKVASEELRGQLAESMPGAVQAMTRAVQKLHPEIKNLNEAGLFEMIKNGKILAEEVLPETSRQLLVLTGADKAQGIDTLTKMTNRLTNSWAKMIQSINDSDSSGFSMFVKKIIGGLTTIMDFTGLLFKDEKQLQNYFKNLGAQQGLEQYQAILNNISGTTKENQDATKKALIERERETIRVNQAIIADEKKKRESIAGGDRALFHLQTKAEEDALVRIGKSAAILKAISGERVKTDENVTEAKKELTKSEIKSEEDRLRAISELRKKELLLELANIDVKLNNEELYYTERLGALDKDFLKRVEIAKVDYEEENRLAKGNQDKQKTALINFQLEKLKLIDGYNKQKTTLEALDLNAITKFDNSKGKTDIDPFKSVGESAEKTVNKLKGFADASEDLKKKIVELNKETKNWLGSFSSEFLQNSGLGSLQIFFDGTFDNLLEGAQNSKEEFAVYFNAIAESAQEAFNFISGISQQNFDNEKTRLQNQYDIALTFAGDNKAAQEKLAEDLEKQKKVIANREAKAKQKQAIFNIAIDTAQAIMGLWAKPGFPAAIPLAIAVGALGAIQIGLVASQKIPQYWMGGTHDGGLMMVNDGKGSNFQETIVTPDGKIMQPKGRNVIMDAPAGTEIYTQDQWNNTLQEMLQGKGVSMSVSQKAQSNGGATAQQIDSIMGKHFSKIQLNNVAFDENGMRVWSERNGNKTISTANRVVRTGIKV